MKALATASASKDKDRVFFENIIKFTLNNSRV